jgi:hypothetical protein
MDGSICPALSRHYNVIRQVPPGETQAWDGGWSRQARKGQQPEAPIISKSHPLKVIRSQPEMPLHVGFRSL